eukprot:scaffold3641_cov32-Tisochrysis_lutea.AAC.6
MGAILATLHTRFRLKSVGPRHPPICYARSLVRAPEKEGRAVVLPRMSIARPARHASTHTATTRNQAGLLSVTQGGSLKPDHFGSGMKARSQRPQCNDCYHCARAEGGRSKKRLVEESCNSGCTK